MVNKLFLSIALCSFSLLLNAVESNEETAKVKTELTNEQRSIVKLFSKLIKKESLTQQEEELLVDIRNYSVGTCTGLGLFHLTGGFAVLSALLLQIPFAIVGGLTIVELIKQTDWEYVKNLFKKVDEQKLQEEAQSN